MGQEKAVPLEKLPFDSKFPYVERFFAMASYQYGKNVGAKLMDTFSPIIVRGKYPRDVSFSSNKHPLGILSFQTNKLVLTPQALKPVLNDVESKIIFAGNKMEGSTLFNQGVLAANPSIRPQDEVVIVSEDGTFLATGTALLPGCLMDRSTSGIAAKIRKKVIT